MKMSSFMDGLIDIYSKSYYSKPDDSDEKYQIIGGWVCCHVLNNLYMRFIIAKEIDEIENISKDKIEKYKRISELYPAREKSKEDSMIAAYILELITSTY